MIRMSPDDIPAFIDEIVATGCEPTAVGDGYIIGDSDLPEPQCDDIQPVLLEIGERYGSRDHLVAEIAAYLTSVGRFYPMPTTH